MKILVVDNYDSFTFNLVHYLRDLGCEVDVRRNDKVTVDEANAFEKILLSPGPGIPSEAGAMPEIVRELAPAKSLLGVCLGHQCIGEVFGGKLANLTRPYHGLSIETEVVDSEDRLFRGIPSRFRAGRYHSWVVSKEGFPDNELAITAVDGDGHIMALRHRRYDVRGVQFHPESILTDFGKDLLKNWIEGGSR